MRKMLGRRKWLELGILFSPILFLVFKSTFRISNFDSLNNLPYKDAVNWSNCSKSLALLGDFPLGEAGSWCLRRPIFAEVSARIYSTTFSLFSLLMIYSIIFGVCLWWNYKLVSGFATSLVGLFVSLIQLGYWCIFASGQMLSENLGIILGTISCGLLLKCFQANTLANIANTAFWISLCLVVRPSNLFLLLIPFFFLASKVYSIKLKSFGILIILFVEALPLLIPKFLASRQGLTEYGNAGNTWSSLYGLANNNSTWNEAYSNLPPGLSDSAYSKIIKERTLDLIGNNPLGMPTSVLKNLGKMFSDGFPFFLPISINVGLVSLFLGILASIFILATIFNYIKNSALELEIRIVGIFYIVSTLLFFAISWKSEPVRVLSPFLGFFFLMLILCWIPRKISDVKLKYENIMRPGIIWILAPTMFLSLNFVSIYSNSSPVDIPRKCKIGEFSLIERTLDFVEVSTIRTTNFFSWGADISSLPNGYLIQGLSSSMPFNPKSIFAPGLSDASSQEIAQLCFKQVSEVNSRLLNLGYAEVSFRS